MSKSIRNLSFSVVALTLAANCTPTTTKDESGGENGASIEGGVSIYDIQMNNYEDGDMLTVDNAIVTSPLVPGDYPAFFIQSAEGGPYSGLYVFMYDEVSEVYEPTVGDVVSITGEYTEFYGNSQLKVTLPENISVTGSGGEVIITDITEEPADWEPYESVMIRITDAEISDASKLYEWGAVQLGIGCWMDNVFTDYEAETCASYASITGPMTYSFEKYSILPRTTADLVDYLGAESSDTCETDCADGIDNDGDGSIDCDDPNCASDEECLEPEICDDGVDNDGDSYIDCDDWDCDDDPACGGSSSGSEICDDGVDNDGNGYVDCNDWDCSDDTACAEDCTDGVDNDGDTFIDCDDFYCDDDPACSS